MGPDLAFPKRFMGPLGSTLAGCH